MADYVAFSEFHTQIRARSGFPPTSAFSARVAYIWSGQRLEEKLEGFVQTGYNSTIQLKDGAHITAEKFHLCFDPEFQQMSHHPIEHVLIISGNSPKMSGNYTVEIYYNEP